MNRHILRRPFGMSIVIAISAMSLVLAGCTAEKPVPGPWSAEFDQGIQDATTDFERDVLADHVITHEEWSEARLRYARCVDDLGFRADLNPDGTSGVEFIGVPLDDEDALEAASKQADGCQVGTGAIIDPLYSMVAGNPTHEDINQLVVQCLIRHDRVSADYTLEQLNIDIEKKKFDKDDQVWLGCWDDPRA